MCGTYAKNRKKNLKKILQLSNAYDIVKTVRKSDWLSQLKKRNGDDKNELQRNLHCRNSTLYGQWD